MPFSIRALYFPVLVFLFNCTDRPMVVMCDWHYYQIMSSIHCLGKCMTLDLYSCIPWEWSTLRLIINLCSPLWCTFFAGWFLIMLTYAHLSPLCPVLVAAACRRPSLIRLLHLLIMHHINPTFRGFGLRFRLPDIYHCTYNPNPYYIFLSIPCCR